MFFHPFFPPSSLNWYFNGKFSSEKCPLRLANILPNTVNLAPFFCSFWRRSSPHSAQNASSIPSPLKNFNWQLSDFQNNAERLEKGSKYATFLRRALTTLTHRQLFQKKQTRMYFLVSSSNSILQGQVNQTLKLQQHLCVNHVWFRSSLVVNYSFFLDFPLFFFVCVCGRSDRFFFRETSVKPAKERKMQSCEGGSAFKEKCKPGERKKRREGGKIGWIDTYTSVYTLFSRHEKNDDCLIFWEIF